MTTTTTTTTAAADAVTTMIEGDVKMKVALDIDKELQVRHDGVFICSLGARYDVMSPITRPDSSKDLGAV